MAEQFTMHNSIVEFQVKFGTQLQAVAFAFVVASVYIVQLSRRQYSPFHT